MPIRKKKIKKDGEQKQCMTVFSHCGWTLKGKTLQHFFYLAKLDTPETLDENSTFLSTLCYICTVAHPTDFQVEEFVLKTVQL